ncbi:alpha/beta hydrolase family protein [Winogradskyella jejuensis]|uniref:Serine aminopeptidase S33 domain-containing protein n=1 Tax=Winogradskyella jejuensis TaxID=1089305 RepID=A0A1M5W0K7_9FLAO|nr:alpha/beta fold hydrolase [Winogradskyella jejuensis]SHH81035.1 hypothetical protein SAMN05444148_2863 [Winogradskyella jejuensis]
MKKNLLILFLLVSKLIFCQEQFNNEKDLDNISDYYLTEVQTEIDDKVTIFGTLLTPKPEFNKIVVIVSGTGKISQKAHNYLTEFLLENNIGVFRFDKRGVGKSTGAYDDRPKTYTTDFIQIYSKLKTLELIKNKSIGFLGHSLGGLVTIQAIENLVIPDFLIQWSAPIGKPRELAKYQVKNGIKNYDKYIISNSIEEKIQILDFVHDVIDANIDLNTWDIWKTLLKEARKKGFRRNQFKNYISNYFVEFAKIDNTEIYKNIDIPTLVIIGKEDILVDPIQSKVELVKIGNPNIEFKAIDELGHFMTDNSTDQKTNEIYDVDFLFKQYLVNWINELNK